MELNSLSPERANVIAALRNAAARTGSDFNYLLGTAMRESGLKSAAQSATSSATSSDSAAHDHGATLARKG